MFLVIHLIGVFVLALSGAGAVYTLLAARILTGSLAHAPASALAAAPSVLVLKPLHGAEPRLEEDLRSFLAQDYPGPVRVRFGLQDPDDGARPIAERLAAEHPDRVEVVIDPRQHGENRKISNLINLARGQSAEFLVFSDSDIRVGPDYLRRVVAASQAPGVGAVTCYYQGVAARSGLPARLTAMGISYAFLPQVALAVRIGAAEPCMGSTIALTPEILERIGGLESVADVLADDYEIGQRVRALGLHVAIPAFAVEHGCDERRFADLWRHELRWQATIRGLDPLGYLGSVVTHVTPLALIGMILTGFSGLAWVVLALALGSRLWLKRRVDALTGASVGPWWLTPGRDILSFAVFAAAASARRVDWRGSRFHVGRDGDLSPV